MKKKKKSNKIVVISIYTIKKKEIMFTLELRFADICLTDIFTKT